MITSTLFNLVANQLETRWIFPKMRHFDLFPKIDTDLVNKSRSGAILTIITFTLLFVLVTSEIISLIYPREKYDFMLNTTIQHDITTYLDMLIDCDCNDLIMETSDILGDQQLLKPKLLTIRDKCSLKAEFPVAKVDGRISILTMNGESNMSHQFNELRFGHQHLQNSLDNTYTTAMKTQVQYFIGLVPTIIETDSIFNPVIIYNQYSTVSVQNEKRPHGIVIKYTLEPISIKVSTHRKSMVEFITRVVGIVGGIWTTVGIIYRLFNKFLWKRVVLQINC